MSLIQLLPENVANQIAAGEVINRPASAVKELLENAVDAGATHIHLLVRDAGKTLIQVLDNGCGMSAEDAEKCFLKHATSKIRQTDDLYALTTMGFRGEALASIAAVACVELKTKRKEDETGVLVEVEGGKQTAPQACTCPNGTQISVKNLYFNTPARRQFLKSDEVEYRYVEEEFMRVAMVHPKIKWQLTRDDKPMYNLSVGTFRQRIIQLMGRAFEQRLVSVHESAGGVSIDGFICTPDYTTKNRSKQYLFVNTRYVKHLGLSHAVETAYKQLVPEKNYPAYFMRLTVPPQTIDVNIHPTKTEIRFEDEKLLYGVMLSVVKHAIGVTQLSPGLDFDNENNLVIRPVRPSEFPQPPSLNLDPSYNPFATEYKQDKSEHYAADSHSEASLQAQLQFYKDTFGIGAVSVANEAKESGFGANFGAGFGAASARTIVRPSKANADTDYANPATTGFGSASGHAAPFGAVSNRMSQINTELSGAVNLSEEAISEAADNDLGGKIMQFASTYIVSTVKTGLLFVDQQAASERIIYDRYLKTQQDGEHQAAQRLLFPQTVQLSASQSDILKDIREKLFRWGWEIEWVGNGSFIVNAAPSQISEKDIARLIENMVDDYMAHMLKPGEAKDDHVAGALAKQSAVKAGQVLSKEEMMSLINDLFASSCPQWSPSGRRTYWIMPETEVKRAFKSSK